MRLLLACLVILLAPIGALLLTQRFLDRSEAEFREDSASQVERLNRVVELYPPNVRKMKSAPAILQLRELTDGGQVATKVCFSAASMYGRLFERLTSRCGEWMKVRRARRYSILGIVLSVMMVGAVLMARIVVRRAVSLQEWPGEWSFVYAKHGVSVLLLGQVGASSLGYWILLKNSLSSPVYSWAILVTSVLAVFWLERFLVMGFVDTAEIADLRPRHTKSGGGAGTRTIGSPRRRRGLANDDRTVWPTAATVKPSVAPPPHSPGSAES